MIKKLNSYLLNKKGMSLVEVLTAMTILTLMIFCFAPLMLSYMDTINISGNKMERVYRDSGNLEVLLGKNSLDRNYTVSIDTVPIELTSPNATITVDGNTQNVSTATIESYVKAYGLTSGGTFAKDKDGNPITDGNINISTGQSTVYTDKAGSASGITLFPSSLTDDFKVAYITIYSADINFVLSQCEFVTTGPTSEISLTKGVDYDIEYHPDRKNPTDTNILLLTVYGGGDNITFETSPLVFKHLGQRYEIQIDAPSMIMVGEKAPDDNYYYYVSRGELDEDGNLLIHRRVMETENDPKGGGTVKLTSAMNDVEWVPIESADSYSKDSSGDSYGYYVMCGDNGQVRRFWKRPDTTITVDGNKTIKVDGNYYWGGDYTYYTDYDFVQVNDSNPAHINSTDKNGKAYADRIYSTDTSFKFISQRDATNTKSGFNVGSKEYTVAGLINTSTALLRGLNVVSVTRADDGEFYGRDGEIYFYELNGNNIGVYPTVTEARNKASSFQGYTVTQWVNTIGKDTGNPAHGWLESKPNSYFDVIGVDSSTVNTDSYPITLTSVDAIYITGTGAAHKTNVTDSSEGSYYFTSTGDGDTIAEGATTNMNYPQESYTLYCGYIPAMMDLFASNTGSGSYKYPTVWQGTYGHSDGKDGTFYVIPSASGINRAGNRQTVQDNIHLYTYWRMTLGVAPYLTSGSELNIDTTKQGNLAFYRESKDCDEYLVHYPYTNLQYAITGKFYDQETFTNNRNKVEDLFKNFKNDKYQLASPNILINTMDGAQQNVTNGEIVDITISYLSHPFAIAVAANPSDDIMYDLSNDKDSGQVFYWNNRRETITFLDSASTMVPSGENDIPVSLMVGYLLGGTVEYGDSGSNTFVNVGSVMNNGIVFLRAGNYNVKKQNASNGQTYEYMATDNGGYKLDQESNVFHQFYYLNSRTNYGNNTGYHGEKAAEPSKGKHIGNLYGAEYWQNNRHIQYRSLKGGTTADKSTASSNYEYLRSHPMSNTKVNCVAWGTTWNGYPEAMWGTENGTVLSWWVNTGKMSSSHNDYDWNDRSVDAEIQSYKWIDNVNGVTFAVKTSEWSGTVGSALYNSGSNAGATFTPGSDRFKYFYDKGTQATSSWGTLGFINTLENINDIEYADDIWIAVGDQSDKDPDDYCANGSLAQSDAGLKANSYRAVIKPYSNSGSGSWVNVRYWVDLVDDGTNKQSDSNSTYHWRAVKISNNKNYNIVQVNNVNGMWIATGYKDANNNEEFDDGEQTVICWTYDPLIPCGEEGGWSEAVKMYDGTTELPLSAMGGINSCATRD